MSNLHIDIVNVECSKDGTLIIHVNKLSDIEKIDKIRVQCDGYHGVYFPYSEVIKFEKEIINSG